MKHKGHNAIPDFSRKRPGKAPAQSEDRHAAAPPRQPVRSKPQSTNAKSGRRGQ